MARESGRRVLGYFPVGNAADATDPFEPLVPKPAGCAAVSGIGDCEGLVAMGRDSSLIADGIDCSDAMQQPPARRPELDLVDQSK